MSALLAATGLVVAYIVALPTLGMSLVWAYEQRHMWLAKGLQAVFNAHGKLVEPMGLVGGVVMGMWIMVAFGWEPPTAEAIERLDEQIQRGAR